VVDARHGKYLPDALIGEIFNVYTKWRPRHIRIEETGYIRGLKTSIRRIEDQTGVYLPMVFNPPDNTRSKEERIKLTLQPWYKRSDIYFDDSLPCLEHFKKELTSFPKGRTDDLIDALADQFQDKSWAGREQDRAVPDGLQLESSMHLTEDQYRAKLARLMKAAQKRKIDGTGEYAAGMGAPVAGWDFYDLTGGL
jgi:predicted phage terminase large subunit-like protein